MLYWSTSGKRVHFFDSDDGNESFSVLADDSLVQARADGHPVLLLADLRPGDSSIEFQKKVLSIVQVRLVNVSAKRFSDVFGLGCEGVL